MNRNIQERLHDTIQENPARIHKLIGEIKHVPSIDLTPNEVQELISSLSIEQYEALLYKYDK